MGTDNTDLIAEFNSRFPYKVELHVHLDGSVRPETVLDIARDRGMTRCKSLTDIIDHVVLKEPSSLERLIASFDYFLPVITGSKSALTRVTYELCEDCAKHNIKYMEVRYSPHFFSDMADGNEISQSENRFTPRDVVLTVNEALSKGMKDFNVKVNTILCCITHKPEWSQDVLSLCQEFRGQGVVGIDLAGQEFTPGTHPDNCQHKQVFLAAYRDNIHRTVHAGEVGTAQAVREALDDMFAERIGHGYHSLDDPETYQRVVRSQVHLETCPISSFLTKACDSDIQKHPLKSFVKDGVNYSINTDDPIVLGNTLTDDYKSAIDMGLTDDNIITGIFNAARSCFASDAEKKEVLAELTAIYGDH